MQGDVRLHVVPNREGNTSRHNAVDGPPPTIGVAYIDHAKPAAAEQIKRARVRLAAVLNAALK